MIYKMRTSIDEERKAKIIAKYIVSSHAAVSVHIRRADTVYAWDDEVVEDIEWEIECLTTCPSKVESVVKGMHSYELAEMIIIPVKAPDKIEEWCIGWCEDQE